MFELFRAGGPLMWVILTCSLLALTIILERAFTLKAKKIAPEKLADQVNQLIRSGYVDEERVELIEQHSPLGVVFAAGLRNVEYGVDDMKEVMEEAGKKVVHRLGRNLNALGTIASVTPLIGLLGTVIGMIKVFTAITAVGVGDPTVLSGGISEALITTAAGLSVGIPCLMFYRFYRSRIAELAIVLEDYAIGMLETYKFSKKATQAVATRRKKKQAN